MKQCKWLWLVCLFPLLLGGFSDSHHRTIDRRTRRVRPSHPTNFCQTADDNIRRAMRAILLEARKSPFPGKVVPPGAPESWQYHDLLRDRFALDARDLAMIKQQGFAVPAKLAFPSYTHAYHEIYQSQLPIFVTLDSVLHTVYASGDSLIKEIEHGLLAPLLRGILQKLHVGLRRMQARYRPETVLDLDLYLSVARSLLSGSVEDSGKPANGDALLDLLARIKKAGGLEQVVLFGRERVIDCSQFTPRGHYTKPELAPFFKCAVWLARLEFNLVSRSCRSSQPGMVPNREETPREALAALALADLAEVTGALPLIERLDRAWTYLAGSREDISLKQLASLRRAARIGTLHRPAAFAALRRAIGSRYRRTVNTHYMPQGTTELPAIATFLGPRIVPDSRIIRSLIDPVVPGRYMVNVADMAYLLGSRRAGFHVTGERHHPQLKAKLNEGAGTLQRLLLRGGDLYSLWMQVGVALDATPRGVLPTLLHSPAWSDLRFNSTVALFAQIKHNFVLMAAQGYDFGGCQIPDGYVEPAPAVYRALIRYAQGGKALLARLDPADRIRGGAYFGRLERICRVLLAIAEHQLSGRALTLNMKRFLSMVVEMTAGGTGMPPTFTGWYFDLFYENEDTLKGAHFISDFYTSTRLGQIRYAGVSGVRMGLFLVNSCGKPRLLAGPVARAFQHVGPLAKRLADEDVPGLAGVDDFWAASYTVPSAPAPPLFLSVETISGPAGPHVPVRLGSSRAIGPVTVTLLDHHRKPLGTGTVSVGAGLLTNTITLTRTNAAVEAVHVRIGDYHHWAEVPWFGLTLLLGGMQALGD